MSRIAWGRLLRIGLVQLRLTPAQFWALTPAELMLVLGPVDAGHLGRDGFEALAARFPDKEG